MGRLVFETDRSKWVKIEARHGTLYRDRDVWCLENCKGPYIMGSSMITEFMREDDAVAFALAWS